MLLLPQGTPRAGDGHDVGAAASLRRVAVLIQHLGEHIVDCVGLAQSTQGSSSDPLLAIQAGQGESDVVDGVHHCCGAGGVRGAPNQQLQAGQDGLIYRRSAANAATAWEVSAVTSW